jgi:tetratricopeptide (TPR) repeat protein
MLRTLPSWAVVLWVAVAVNFVMSTIAIAATLGYLPWYASPSVRVLLAIEKAVSTPQVQEMLRNELRRYATDARQAETGARGAAATLTPIAILFSVVFFAISAIAYSRLVEIDSKMVAIDERLRKVDQLTSETGARFKSATDQLQSRFERLIGRTPDPYAGEGIPLTPEEAAEIEDWDQKATLAPIIGQKVDPRILAALGNYYYFKGNYARSALRYRRAVADQLDTRLKAAYRRNLGVALLGVAEAELTKEQKVGICREGIAELSEAKREDQSLSNICNFHIAWFLDEIARTVDDVSKFHEAIDLLDVVIERSASQGDPRLVRYAKFNKACVLVRLGRKPEAVALLREIRDIPQIKEEITKDPDTKDLANDVFA